MTDLSDKSDKSDGMVEKHGASYPTRTGDLVITNHLLYQLS